ncbi:MAG: putative baseplate assembly protein, partial [Nannocystaceae bacterium]
GGTFYIDCGDALAKPPGALISFVVKLGEAALDRPPVASGTLRLVWEVRNDTGGWTIIGRSSGTKSFAPLANEPNSQQFADQTLALTKPGRVEFRLPHTVTRAKIGQRRGRWLRVRVSRGDYGGLEHVAYNEQSQRYEIQPATLAPPVLSSIRIGFEHSVANVDLEACISNDLGHLRHHRVAPGHPSYKAFLVNPPQSRFPSLYICLDREVEQSSLSFFVDVLPPEPVQSSPDNYSSAPRQRPEVYWDYYGADGWRRLGVKDTTSTLRERGTVRFVGPDDLTQTAIFGITGRWLRIQWTRGEFRTPPRIAKILLNTVWASHCVTRRGELLGSGNSTQGQVFRTAATPVLDDHEIDVRELLDPTEEELTELFSEVREERLDLIRNAADRVAEVWVRWSPVLHFHESGQRDRHYTLDSASGTVVFGDGVYGMAVPRGQGNVRLTRYRTGGGVHGNRPKGAVSELKTSVPYVDSVVNHVPSSGGTSAEPDERVRVRGPMRLRHRERAVTPSDYEDLALEAAPEVVRAHAMLVPFNPIDLVIDLSDLDSGEQGAARTSGRGRVVLSDVPGDVTHASKQAATVHVVIVPNSDEDQPAPSLGLLERVDTYLHERASTAVRLRISGPRWIKVTVTATIVPEEGADPDRLVVAVEQSIQRFLNPLTGGDNGEGWSFGRAPQRSHLFRRIDSIPGVHHVRQLELSTDPSQPEG